jgi:hypothetical protein
MTVDEQDRIPDTLVPANKHVYFNVGSAEMELREQVKQVGGCWSQDKKAWHLE